MRLCCAAFGKPYLAHRHVIRVRDGAQAGLLVSLLSGIPIAFRFSGRRNAHELSLVQVRDDSRLITVVSTRIVYEQLAGLADVPRVDTAFRLAFQSSQPLVVGDALPAWLLEYDVATVLASAGRSARDRLTRCQLSAEHPLQPQACLCPCRPPSKCLQHRSQHQSRSARASLSRSQVIGRA